MMERIGLVLMIALVLSALHPGRARGAFSNLTASELQRVLAGERVVHKREEHARGLHLIGGTAYQRVDAPADVVWAVAVRPDLYRHVLPYVVEARAVDGGVIVRHAFPLREASYRLRIRRDDARRVLSFSVLPDDSGSDADPGPRGRADESCGSAGPATAAHERSSCQAVRPSVRAREHSSSSTTLDTKIAVLSLARS